ncbi:MAG: hypothetical protein QM703_20165 [Gemmatales bacterium]
MSNESPTKQLSVGVWAIIIASLVLSSAAILLHLTKMMDHFVDRSSRYGSDVFQVQNQLNQLRGELSKLQADIAMANNFNQLKKSMGMAAPSSGTSGALPNANRASSPHEAVMLLEQANRILSFEEYQAIQPGPQRKQLEELYQSNRELRTAYQALLAEVEGRFADDEVLAVLNENEASRLNAYLFPTNKRFDIVEVTNTTDGKAKIKVIEFTMLDAPGSDTPKEAAQEVFLDAVTEGSWWKVADNAQAQTDQKARLAKLKEQTTKVKALTQQVTEGKFKNKNEFQKAWDALPMIKK